MIWIIEIVLRQPRGSVAAVFVHIYIDESGTFDNSVDALDRVGVAVGVIVAQSQSKAMWEAFGQWETSLADEERIRGETKGSQLSRSSRLSFARLITSAPSVRIVPATAELPIAGTVMSPSLLRQDMEDQVAAIADRGSHSQLSLLAKQIGNLSDAALLKLQLFGSCIDNCVAHAIMEFSSELYHGDWPQLTIEIDQLSTRHDSREHLAFQGMLLPWMLAHNKHRPLILNEDHTGSHPFMKAYDDGTRISYSRLFSNPIIWSDSRSSAGLRIADIAANTVFQAVRDSRNVNNLIPPFVELMAACPSPPRDALGLVQIVNKRDGRLASTERFDPLVKALCAKYPERLPAKCLREFRESVAARDPGG